MNFKPLISVISTFKPIQLDYIENEILSNIFEKNYSAYTLEKKFKNSRHQRHYSKINRRLKNLEAANLIERIEEKFKRNAINYKITTLGLIFLYTNRQSISFSDILRYDKDTLFKTLVFQFFEKRTILTTYNGLTENDTNSFKKIDDNEDLAIIYENILQSSTNHIDDNYGPPFIQYLITKHLHNCCTLIFSFCNDFFKGLSKSSNGVNVEYQFRGVKLPDNHIIQRYIEYLDDYDEPNLIIDQTIIDGIQKYQTQVKKRDRIEQNKINENLNKKNEGLPSDKQLIVTNDIILNEPSKETSAEYFNSINNIGYENELFPKSKFLTDNNKPPYPLDFNRIDLTEQLEWQIKSFVLKIITKNLPLRLSHYCDDVNDSYSELILFLLRDNKFKELAKKIKDEFEEGSKFLKIQYY